MMLTMNSLAEPFLPGEKKPQRTILLNYYTLHYSCVIDLQKTHLYPTTDFSWRCQLLGLKISMPGVPVFT